MTIAKTRRMIARGQRRRLRESQGHAHRRVDGWSVGDPRHSRVRGAHVWPSGYVKRTVITVLRQRFNGEVEIRNLRVFIFPRVYVTAYGIVLRREGRTDIPPFLSADELTVSADLASLFESPRKVASVRLDGLRINVPPRDPNAPHQPHEMNLPVVLEEVTANECVLVMLPRDPKRCRSSSISTSLCFMNSGPSSRRNSRRCCEIQSPWET